MTIFRNKSGIPVHTANRLRRYALTLLGYDFTISYIDNANFAYADFVSRLINAHTKPGEEDVVIAEIRQEDRVVTDTELYDKQQVISALSASPITPEELERASEDSEHLCQVIKYVRTSWPALKRQVSNTEAAEYFQHKDSLHVVGNRLFHGDRPVIPPVLRPKILSDLHEGHPGCSRMQALARTQFFWPHINDQIASFVQRCVNCATNAKSPRKEVLHPWPRPNGPSQRLHIDFAGPVGSDFF